MKACKACKTEKPLAEFYKHPQMADGHDQNCKDCRKAMTRRNYEKSGGRAEYERTRAQTPERKAKMAEYQRTRRSKYPDKAKARTAVSNAIRDGRMKRQPCGLCGGEDAQAHHYDYSKPLDVLWRCFKCHREEEHGQTVRF